MKTKQTKTNKGVAVAAAAPLTGRRARYRGKSAFLTLRLRPETLARIQKLARAESVTVADAVELLVERSA
jgi:hypothetical protein